MNEIVKYDNTLNTMQFKDFSAMDYNILMCLCHKVRDKGSKKLVFTFNELKEATNFGNHSDNLFKQNLDRMIDKLIHVDATHVKGSKESHFILFPTFTVDVKKKTLTVRVNEDFAYILNELTDNFTRFELREFAELDSKYAKTLYRILKQYRKGGFWKPTVEELRIVMDIPDSFDNKKIMGKIIKPTIETLGDKFEDLKCEPIRAQKRGAPIEKYLFTFRAEDQIRGQRSIGEYYGVMPGEKTGNKAYGSFEQNDFSYADIENELLANN